MYRGNPRTTTNLIHVVDSDYYKEKAGENEYIEKSGQNKEDLYEEGGEDNENTRAWRDMKSSEALEL